MRKQLFLNFKGGTGKTSLSTSYAYRLAEMGHRVLLIDLDSQGHATQHLGVAVEAVLVAADPDDPEGPEAGIAGRLGQQGR